ncbi:MAG: helix-turn-helix domain-containing protein [Planctomycetes bacterium]|nr:helix-turn-helix domain-containing protein [Planctomycetota bacterium]
MIQSVDRALDLLEAVCAAPEGLPLGAMAAAAGLRTTTAHNLAATLVRRGYLAKTARPMRYVAGAALHTMMGAVHGEARGRWMETAVRDLARRRPEATVTAAVDRGGDVTVVVRMSPEQPGQVQHPAHQVLRPYHSVAALVFQALWPAERRQGYRMRYPFDEDGSSRWPSPDALEAFLAQVRRTARAVLTDGDTLLRAAVPVFSAGNELFATLGAATPDLDRSADLVADLAAVAAGAKVLR